MAILNNSHARPQRYEEQDAVAVTVQWDDSSTFQQSPIVADAIPSWQEQGQASTDAVLKILLHEHSINEKPLTFGTDQPSIPFSEKVLQSAFDAVDEYILQWRDPAGGCRLQADRYGFIVQTPIDHADFCSFAVNLTNAQIRGVWITSSEVYKPHNLLASTPIRLEWNKNDTGLHMAIVPIAFLHAYSQETSSKLDEVLNRIQSVETAVRMGYETLASEQDVDFTTLFGGLHWCSTKVTQIEQRWRLRNSLTDIIMEFVTLNDIAAWGSATHKKQFEEFTQDLSKRIAAREAELSALPRRIKRQSSAIANLLLHRDAQLTRLIARQNVDIAESSRRTAEATRRDSQSMKTIAVLTMVFLPGTFVASFFSTALFNWSPNQGEAVASAYVWIYFVITIPMTAITIGLWYFWTGRQRQQRINNGGQSKWTKEP